jgi:biopolymer transport protein ExbD
MSWKLRHTGSPQVIPNLTPQQIAEGMVEGEYEPTDEVMGPNDKQWIPMDEHPHFEETVTQYLESQDEEHEGGDDDHIDMNPLIDVCLVLLVIFIMAQSMALLEKVIEAPKAPKQSGPTTRINADQLPDNMVMIKAISDGKTTTIELERDKIVIKELKDFKELVRRLTVIKHNNERKTDLVVQHRNISHGTMVMICDAAAQSGLRNVKLGKMPGGGGSPGAPAGGAPRPQ